MPELLYNDYSMLGSWEIFGFPTVEPYVVVISFIGNPANTVDRFLFSFFFWCFPSWPYIPLRVFI